MRRIEFTIHTQNYSSGKKRWRGTRLLQLFLTTCLLLTTLWGTELNAQCALVCNDDENVSMPGTDIDCEVEITIDMVLEDPNSCPNGILSVELLDIQGQPLPTSPVLNETHIGATVIYSVTDEDSGNSCWGTLTVEDKLGPTIENCDNWTVPCVVDYRPTVDGGDLPAPDISDCSGVLSKEYSDAISQTNCGPQNDVAVVTRTWTAVDALGNVSTCTQMLSIERVSLLNYTPVCPPNVILECDTIIPSTDPADTGYPTVEISGVVYPLVPGTDGFCELASSYTDEVFDICGGGYKILRTWNVYDWCHSTDPNIPNPFTCIQVIKVEDKKAPTITCPGPLVFNASATVCAASVSLPPAQVWDMCSGWEVKILTPFGIVDGNGGPLLNIPVGEHTITYVATDACGNISTCPVTLTIEDNTPPVAVCDEHTTVSLSADGEAIVSPEVFDDGSEDNCGIDYFEVRRMNEVNFNTFVSFYCSHIGNPTMVVMRVWDAAGNYNECMVEVDVQDKIPPVITCPPNQTIECDDPVPPVSAPTIDDNCSNTSWTHTEMEGLSGCGTGTITRTYTATDVGGQMAECTQTIFVQNNSVFSLSDISWPSNYMTNDCGPSLEPLDLPAGFDRPAVNEGPCDNVAVTYTDQNLPTNPPACFKILRKWVIIDWCQYDPNTSNSDGYWEHTQVIKVEDNEAPVVTCPPSLIVNGYDPNCLAEDVVIPPVMATDCSTNFTFNATVDLFTNGSNDLLLNTPDASGSYPFGIHTFVYTVEDLCGNATNCAFKLTVRDVKKPTPICVNGLAVELMADPINGGGMIDLSSAMFNKGSFDNCTAPDDLTFEVTPSFFDCGDVGSNVVYLYVTDEAGNVDFCETYVIIQDNMVICPNPSVADVSGNISTPTGSGVNNVTVDVSGNGPFTPSVTTNPDGHFEFFDLGLGHDYTFTPNHNTGFLNGVTTYDLVLMTQHILNVKPFDSPYKYIAGDVNNNGKVTTADVVELRKLILSVISEFSNNTSWRFIDSDHTFINPTDPFQPSFSEYYNINNLSADEVGVDFVAVKIGDVNGTATTNFKGDEAEDRNQEEVTFVVDDREVQAGETFTVAFKANNFTNLIGYQFALQFDANKMQLADIATGDLKNLTETNFGLTMLDRGIITTSWDNAKNTIHDHNTILFSLAFEANTNTTLSEVFRISKSTLTTEAYQDIGNGAVETMDVGLAFNSPSDDAEVSFELYQNNPNPFKESTNIGFRLPENSEVALTIFDLSGKVLMTTKGNYAKGYNEITVHQDQLGSAGVLFYQLETQGYTRTQKMVRM